MQACWSPALPCFPTPLLTGDPCMPTILPRTVPHATASPISRHRCFCVRRIHLKAAPPAVRDHLSRSLILREKGYRRPSLPPSPISRGGAAFVAHFPVCECCEFLKLVYGNGEKRFFLPLFFVEQSPGDRVLVLAARESLLSNRRCLFPVISVITA